VIRYKEKKIAEGHYEYRGNSIHQNKEIKEGAMGAWYTTGGARLEMVATCLEAMLGKIDARLDH